MKLIKLFKNAFIIILFLSLVPLPLLAKGNSNNDMNLSAKGIVLIDVSTGRILYEKNPDLKMRIASLTKIMTAIVAIENGDLEDKVITSNRAYGVEGSSIYLRKDEKLSLENMLYGLMLRSGNDAAVAIAEHIGGSLEGFTYLMNQKASYIGMNHSHFMNPHGLDHVNHYSTPRDMAKLTAYALKNNTFKKIVGTKVKTAPLAGEKWERKWYNKNKLLTKYQWADGVKTGYTKLARRCLASSATKNGVQLAVITLNDPDDWNDHMKLLEYGFNQFKHVKLIQKGEYIGEEYKNYPLFTSSDFVYSLKEEEESQIKQKINFLKEDEILSHTVGKLEFYLKDNYIGSIPLEIKDNSNF